ncbi:MAG: rhodanese-like domain-containing protein [Methanothrix sp.]|nr:rhodanese-like domain-containing protein [Methanothrix sp.]
MKKTIVVILAVLILVPSMLAAGQETSPNYMLKADEFMKDMIDNGLYLISVSDVINATENETEMASWVILDVRPEAGYASGHIPNSMNIPFTNIVSDMDAVPSDKKIAVVCTYDTNSAFAVAMLRVFGDRDAWIVQGGIPAWQEAGKELAV